VRSLRIALVAFIVACQQGSSPPQPQPKPAPTAPADAAVAVADAAPPAPKYRTDQSGDHRDPSVAGSGKTFMVVSESEPATKAGHDILAAGGNAVDAAVATAFALAVSHPTAGNIGGGGFAVVHVAPGKDVALDFRETAPAAATPTMYLDDSGKPTKDSLIGHRASGVPGSVAGLYELHKKLGKKPWKDVVAPAVALARDGFTVDRFLWDSIVRPRNRMRLEKFPATAAIWIPNHRPVEVGAVVKQPDLAATLERIADKGPDGFYAGPTADAIVAEMKRGGGIITAADLKGYKPVWRDPMKVGYGAYTLVTMPLPSSGGIVENITANMLRGTELRKLGWHSAAHVHWLVEIWRRAFAARNELLGDPSFVKPPIDRLTSQTYADKLVTSITDKATPSASITPLLEGQHTTNLSVVDGNGMAVALTTTINTSWGSCVTVEGAGFLLNNEMDDFAAKPGSPNIFGLVQGEANKIEPGKRMLSSMTPTIALDAKNAPYMVAGAGGGPRIITAVWQTISNVLDFGMAVDAAVASPRVHHQHLPDVVFVEADAIDRGTGDQLSAMGYKLDWSNEAADFGEITAIVKSARGWDGSSDPRRGGKAMGD
jgi:gamma-glutamyltranspeptidase / glutathione hydrolase